MQMLVGVGSPVLLLQPDAERQVERVQPFRVTRLSLQLLDAWFVC